MGEKAVISDSGGRHLEFIIFCRFWLHDLLLVAADDNTAKFH